MKINILFFCFAAFAFCSSDGMAIVAKPIKATPAAKMKVGKTRKPAQEQALVGSPIACKPIAWPYTRDASLSELRTAFISMPRRALVKIVWSELSVYRADSIAVPLLHYLASTTDNPRARAYFETIGYLSMKDSTPSEAVKQWPVRVPMQKEPLKLEQLCALYNGVSQ